MLKGSDRMKKVINSLFMFILGGIIFGSIVYATTYYAKDVAYEPTDTSWEVSNVEDALNALYANSDIKLKKLITSNSNQIIVDPNAFNKGYPYTNAFDGDINTLYISEGALNDYIGYDFLEPVRLDLIKYIGQINYSGFGKSTIQGSDDGIVWDNVEEFDGGRPTAASVTIVNSSKFYRYWRIVNNESFKWGLFEIEFYGAKKK